MGIELLLAGVRILSSDWDGVMAWNSEADDFVTIDSDTPLSLVANEIECFKHGTTLFKQCPRYSPTNIRIGRHIVEFGFGSLNKMSFWVHQTPGLTALVYSDKLPSSQQPPLYQIITSTNNYASKSIRALKTVCLTNIPSLPLQPRHFRKHTQVPEHLDPVFA